MELIKEERKKRKPGEKKKENLIFKFVFHICVNIFRFYITYKVLNYVIELIFELNRRSSPNLTS